MRIKMMIIILILSLGLSSLTKAGNGYLISDTSIKVNYIICSTPNPQECNNKSPGLTPQEIALNHTLTSYKITTMPEGGIIKIISLTTTHDKQESTYMYSNNFPCVLYDGGAVKFERYDDIITCRSQPTAVVQ